MDTKGKRSWLIYAGLPILCVLTPLIARERADTVRMLIRELALIFGYVASVTDITEHRVPNKLVLAILGAWGAVMIPQLFYRTDEAAVMLLDAVLGAVSAGGLFLLVYFVSRKGLGGGDVKLMTVMGLYFGLSNIMTVMLIGSVAAALVGLILIAFKKIGPKDSIPLVPFLYAGMVVTVFFR